MACNCKNTDELRIVRGNAFSMEINIEARRLDGTLVEDFDLSQAEATLKVVYYDQKTVKTFSVVGNSAIIGFDNTMPLGWYGLEMTGTYNAAPWRWCVTKVFQIVETNEKANIPTWTFLTDDTYVVDGVLTLMSGDVYQADWDETNIYSPSYIKNKPDVVLHPEFNQTVQRIDRDIDDEETRAKGAEQTLQEHIDAEALARGNADTTLQGNIDNEESRAKGVEQGLDGRLTTAEGDIDTIEGKIPAAASSQNQLVDQNQMNSSISTATATYRGAYNLVSDLELTVAATEQQIAAALATKMTALSITPDNNDYCFVQVPTADATPTEIARVDRYKFNGTAWAFEFSLNNSGFTAAQWAALNSGITSGLVTKLSDLPTNSELTTLLAGKQAVIVDLADIRSGAAKGETAYQKPVGGIPSEDMSSGVQSSLQKAEDAAPQSTTYNKTEVDGMIGGIEEKIPSGASSQNKLVDQQTMNSSIATATATYRGAYNLVSDLELTTAATEQQIAASLATKMTALGITPDNNDYCFVQVPTADATPTEIARVDRYKYNGTAWAFEFSLNNSGFTAAQWAALNSGITSGLVTKLSDLPTNSELTTLLNGKADKVSGATAGNFAGLDGNGNLTDSGKKASDFATAAQGTKADEAAPQSTTYTKTEVDGLVDDEETRAKGVEQGLDGRLTTAEGDIDTIEGKIPAAASSQNQLVDQNQMNSSISTATATYRGAYNLVSDLELTTAATEQQIAAALATKMTALGITPDNNDYCFVQVPTADATPTEIARVDRYKYNGTAWAFEFSLNNSGFTAAQWAALNSGITSGLVTKLSDLPTNSELTTLLGGKADKVSGATSGNFAGLDGNGNLTDSGKKASDFQLVITDGATVGLGYGVSNTVAETGKTIATTPAQTAALANFILLKNMPVCIRFLNAISCTRATLNINNTGAKPLFIQGAALQPGVVKTEDVVTLIYDGTNWNIVEILSVSVSQSDLYVDMGLPSGRLWAIANLDATTQSGFAEVDGKPSPFKYECTFFSWGNNVGHNPISESAFDYDWGSSNSGPYASTPGATLTANAGLSFDAARAILGAPWRDPSTEDFAELFANIDYVQADGETVIDASQANKLVTVNSITGIYLKSKINGRLLFFPCSGLGYGQSWYHRGSSGFYWSRSLSSQTGGRNMNFSSGGVSPQYGDSRFYGFARRAVQ